MSGPMSQSAPRPTGSLCPHGASGSGGRLDPIEGPACLLEGALGFRSLDEAGGGVDAPPGVYERTLMTTAGPLAKWQTQGT